MAGCAEARPGLGRALLSPPGALEFTMRCGHCDVLVSCPALLKEISRERHVFLEGEMLARREPRSREGLTDHRIANGSQAYTDCRRYLFAAQRISQFF